MRDLNRQLLTLLPLVEGKPDAMVALARQLVNVGQRSRALDLAERALALAPGDGEVRTIARELLSDGVPSWHFTIVRDAIRNRAYEEALRRAIFPGCKVLEIGTGSGLLAMMAARLGAEVITCEADSAIAGAARDVVAANGFADRVRVVNRHSSDLDPDKDLGGRADILVSEIVSNDLLSEAVIPAHRDAVARLLKPDAAVIPARGQVRVALAEVTGPIGRRMGKVSGFDLSGFNRLARPYFEVPVDHARLELRSAPIDLFDFDFACALPLPNPVAQVAIESNGGPVAGIAQWIALDMDGHETYENRPGTGVSSCWGATFWPLAETIQTNAGQIITVAGRHETDRIRLWRSEGLC
jgi:protein arginine N-methyltransferase 7